MSIETLVRNEVEKTGLEYEKVVLETGRVLYSIAGVKYIPRDAANTFLEGGWEKNYRDA